MESTEVYRQEGGRAKCGKDNWKPQNIVRYAVPANVNWNREYVLHYTLGRSNRPSDVKNHEQRLALEVALNLKWPHVGRQNTCACPTTDMT